MFAQPFPRTGAAPLPTGAPSALAIADLSLLLLLLLLLLLQIAATGRKVHVVAPDYGEYARSYKL